MNHKTTFSCRNCVLHFLRIVINHDWKELEHELKRVCKLHETPCIFVCLFSFNSTLCKQCLQSCSSANTLLSERFYNRWDWFLNPLRCNNRFDLIDSTLKPRFLKPQLKGTWRDLKRPEGTWTEGTLSVESLIR